MKRRSGLVSNSSSSSFTCDVCGETESGMDAGLSDFEMVECGNGHIVCELHLLEMTDETAKEFIKEAIKNETLEDDTYEEAKALLAKGHIDAAYAQDLDQEELFGYDWRYEYPTQLCPICQSKDIPSSYLVDFLLNKLGISIEEAQNEVRSEFKNLDEMYKTLKV